MELELPVAVSPEEPLFRSRYGGLWIDRRDAHEVLAGLRSRGEVTAQESSALAQYIDEGYVVFPGAVGDDVIDEYLDLFERSWDEAPSCIYAHVEHKVVPLSRALYDKIAKVSCLHCCFDRAGELVFPPAVLRFLTLIYDRPPVAFQTMTMRKGSEEVLHTDTGPLTLTEPMTMAASWLALEDVRPGSGELEFVPGSHSVPEHLHPGMSKGHNDDMGAYGQVLEQMKNHCAERGFTTERFAAKKGDVLIWHADLLHGGAKIENPSSTRKSLVTHFMPLGVMPTFYDSSEVTALPYPGGGYCLDRLVILNRVGTPGTTEDDAEASDDGETTATEAAVSNNSQAAETTPTPDDGGTTGIDPTVGEVPPQPAEGPRRPRQHVPHVVRKALGERLNGFASNAAAGHRPSDGSR
jgi:ectoine hydroxylase-related dioxygenase (phytanoyl-CoA dioxygenase family)